MSVLTSFSKGINAAVFGASGGIGGALLERLSDDLHVDKVVALSRHKPQSTNENLTWIPFDLEHEETIQRSTVRLGETVESLDLILVATGVLHDGEQAVPEKSIKTLTADAMNRVFKINATGPALIGKHASPLLCKTKRSVIAFLSARVGSISDNRLGGWYSYRASKAALHMIVKTLAIELRRTHPNAICVSMHPGTVNTPLSHPFISRKGKTAVGPNDAAMNLLSVINTLEQDQTGSIWDWQGKEIEP